MNKKSNRFDLMALIAIAVFFLGIVFWKVPLHYPYILGTIIYRVYLFY